jgi:hypothetical protein
MSEMQAVTKAYKGNELTTARRRIREATTLAQLEEVCDQADTYYQQGLMTRAQAESIAYASWAKSRDMM